MGQYEDSRRAEPGWQLPGHDTSGWSEAVVTSRDTSMLVPEADQAVRVTGRVPAVAVMPRGEGRFVVDFGQNLVGRVALTLTGQPPGTRVQLTHAEVLDERGELYTANLRTAEPVDVFWTDGSPVQVFEPRFTLHGFRYAEVAGLTGDLSPEQVEAVVLHNDFALTGAFETSSADLNALASNITWSLRGNFVSIPTDCPQRDERLGWLADAQVFAPTALLLADVAPLLRRWMRDVRIGQSAGRRIPRHRAAPRSPAGRRAGLGRRRGDDPLARLPRDRRRRRPAGGRGLDGPLGAARRTAQSRADLARARRQQLRRLATGRRGDPARTCWPPPTSRAAPN